jgi:type III pantothenate kinase
MRLVTVDNGNTNPNVAIHSKDGIAQVYPLDKHHSEKEDVVVIASVGKPIALKASFELKKFRTQNSFFDMPVHYAMTLGEDRLVTAYYTFKALKKNETVMVIDAGTFVTCDLVNAEGFQGGYIFPGIDRFLNTYGQSAQLPTLSKDQLKKYTEGKKIPQTTEDAILMATNVYCKSMLKEMISKHSPDKLIFTGGSAIELSSLISSEVPFELIPHLVHSSLRLIFDLHLQAKI